MSNKIFCDICKKEIQGDFVEIRGSNIFDPKREKLDIHSECFNEMLHREEIYRNQIFKKL